MNRIVRKIEEKALFYSALAPTSRELRLGGIEYAPIEAVSIKSSRAGPGPRFGEVRCLQFSTCRHTVRTLARAGSTL